ncbi:N-acetylgalactosaminyltransferase 7-like [Ptychodera flava]|uniref:N-acetylgalactosaminyltransferase 7-like n=1 Tax=Ptychodera flava TaxID=63121 RepID=UPI003969ED5C
MSIYYWKKTRVLQLLVILGCTLCSFKVFMSLPADDYAPVNSGDLHHRSAKHKVEQSEIFKGESKLLGIQRVNERKHHQRKGHRVPGLVHVSGNEVDLQQRRKNLNIQVESKHEDVFQGVDTEEESEREPGEVKKMKFGNDLQNGETKLTKATFMFGKLGNYEPPETEPRTGFGENGIGVKPNPVDEARYRDSIREYGFNLVISDQISLDRSVKDIRDPECKYWHYPEDLPRASVVIVFINEGWSTLMRTVHSVINSSPPHLLAEIVLVDDFSDKDHLGKRLEDYIAQPKFNDKVKLVRNKQREGLIRSRTIGAVNAERGEAVVFLDAHCECSKNWLPPLLTRIKEDRTAVVCPMVDSIDAETYNYRAQAGGMARGVFNWDFFYKRIPITNREIQRREKETEPYRSPVMAGGLFALSRSFFFDIGGYDSGLDIWGGEQYEISFKIWMCGGSLEFVPCSRVGHIYRRGGLPYTYPRPAEDGVSTVNKNYLRVAEVWMDEYKEYFYRMKPELRGKSYGDVSQQKQMRQEKCPHSFRWFMDEVAYDIVERFPLPAENIAWGAVAAFDSHYCLDNEGMTRGAEVSIHRCHGLGGSQLFRLNEVGQFRVNEECLYADNGDVRQQRCVVGKRYGWFYKQGTSHIAVTTEDKNTMCLDHDASYKDVFLSPCQDDENSQKWIFRQ